jgi:phosphatidate cytidylyltransferase
LPGNYDGNHRKRWFTAIWLLALIVPLLAFGGRVVFGFISWFVVVFSMHEYLRLIFPEAGRFERHISLFLVGILPISGHSGESALVKGLLIITFGMFFFYLFRRGGLKDIADRMGKVSLGFIYVGFLLSYFVLLRGIEGGSAWIFFLLSVIFSGDTMAYYVGKGIGRHKLYPKVSPAKTWEGSIGGLIGNMIASLTFWFIFFRHLPIFHFIIMAIGIGIFGQLGDLCESMIKRGAGKKDSGSILPGHGGLLDRIDSLIFSAPFLYQYISLIMSDNY